MGSESKFARDYNGNIAVRVISGEELLPATDSEWMFGRDKNGNIAIRVIGSIGAGGGDVIIKTRTMPEASEEEFGNMRIYSGETNETYTHGYIYECVGVETYDITPIIFEHSNIGFDYRNADERFNYQTDGEAMQGFLQLVLRNTGHTFIEATTIELTRRDDMENSMWYVAVKNSLGESLVSEYLLYRGDLEAFGFTFIVPESEYIPGVTQTGEYSWVRHLSGLAWERINVQP